MGDPDGNSSRRLGAIMALRGCQDVPLKSTSLVLTVPAVRPGAVW